MTAAANLPVMGAIALLITLYATLPGSDEPWRWPLHPAPAVIRGFAPPAVPWGPGHRGVDLVARPGQVVYAAGAGRVSYAGRIAGRGVIAITHGELRTTYLPVRPSVRSGQQVTAGTRIGVVQRRPAHCLSQPCLHWGLRHGLVYLDPLTLVRPRVRLLPHWPLAPTTPHARSPRVPNSPSNPHHPMALSSASAAAGGAVAGMMLAFVLSLAWRRIPTRRSPTRRGPTRRGPTRRAPTRRVPTHRSPPPGVIDLTHERRIRRPKAGP